MPIGAQKWRVFRCLTCNALMLLATDLKVAGEATNCAVCPQVFGDQKAQVEDLGVLVVTTV